MGGVVTDADKNVRSSVLGESFVWEQELHCIAYDRVELEDRAKAMKIHDAFVKALTMKLGENYMQQRLTWRVHEATFNPELDREEGME